MCINAYTADRIYLGECAAVYKAVKKVHVRREEKQDWHKIDAYKWKDQFSVAIKDEWIRALIVNLDEWMSRTSWLAVFSPYSEI